MSPWRAFRAAILHLLDEYRGLARRPGTVVFPKSLAVPNDLLSAIRAAGWQVRFTSAETTDSEGNVYATVIPETSGGADPLGR